jgi:thymidylate kinase
MNIVTFSGIDGAGKTTQILELQSWLRQAGVRTKLFTFWDDVVVFSRFREFMSHKAFKGDRGVGSPERPLQRRDKNVSSASVTAMRFGLYLADAISLAATVRRLRKSEVDVVIFDRYMYDELANLPLRRPLARMFTRLILGLIPKPDIAYVIDAEPVKAWARKPDYPLEFVSQNRETYVALARLVGHITVVEHGSIENTASRIRSEVVRALSDQEAKLSKSPAFFE